MKGLVGCYLLFAAFIYFYVFFDVDYGVTLDEVGGLFALCAGALLLLWDYADRENDRHEAERVKAWKDGNP